MEGKSKKLKSEETKTETETEKAIIDDDDDGNPGKIIIFTDADAVHAALGLGSVANIQLPVDVASNISVLQQAHDAGESLTNLQPWLDALACSTAGSAALVKKIDGTRLHGVYHDMLQPDHLMFMRALNSLSAWHTECQTTNSSCGTLLSLEPGKHLLLMFAQGHNLTHCQLLQSNLKSHSTRSTAE